MAFASALVMLAAMGLLSAFRVADGADLAPLVRPAVDRRPVSLRIQWGGGTPQAWAGSIEVVAASEQVGGPASRRAFTWRTLSSEPDAAAMAHETAAGIAVHQTRPLPHDGVEISVPDWQEARLVVRLATADGSQPATTLEIPLAELLIEPPQQVLDTLGNRLTAKPSPGDALRVTAALAAGDAFTPQAIGLVRRPGDLVRLRVEPLIATRLQAGHAFDLRMRLRRSRQGAEIAVQSTTMTPLPAADARGLTAFEPVVFDVTLPAEEGAYDVELEAVERGGMRWSRPLVSRTVEFAAVTDAAGAPPAKAADDSWKTVYEVDPGSPRLHERLRRLPGMHLPSMPDMPLPSMSLPKLPGVPLPNMPMPNVPMPNVSAMVPRLSGLLTQGHSVVTAHSLGPMLQLPPARTDSQPAWEGIVLAGVQPGLPHAVEIQYPTDQDAVVGVSVLEADATETVVESRHGGGFEVRKARFSAEASRLAIHRFVFWPTTRNPLVLISNPSTSRTATIGRVRVTAGPERLPAAVQNTAVGSLVKVESGTRRTYGFLATPELVREFGGIGRVGEAGGRPVADWGTHVAAARHLAESLASQAAGGALVTAYAQGAAIWPSELTRHAPRWISSSAAGGGIATPDVLEVVSRMQSQHGLGLIPGLCFDAPLPAVETAIAVGGMSPGRVCVGRDGRPRRLANGGLHYNVLDPLVQRSVEDVVVEMATRLRGSSAVDGVAVMLPHDGWLHFPGLAWGLDDTTFARFLATLETPPPSPEGDGRFADRARLVEGPLRDRWMAWRCAEVGTFHGKLAAAVAAIDARWSLYLVPTTLFAEGDLAAFYQPSLVTAADADDPVRIAGIDMAVGGSPAAGNVVFVTPHVHSAAGGIREQARRSSANRSAALARAARAAARRGAVIVEQPVAIDLSGIVPHGPFGAAASEQPGMVQAAPVDGRPLAEVVAVADAEIVFDAGLVTACGPASPARLGYESLPRAPLEPVAGVPASLVVRTCRVGGMTWVSLVNASAASARAILVLGGQPSAVVDAVNRTALPFSAEHEVAVPLEPWGMHTVILDGGVTVQAGRIDHDDTVRREVASRIAGLRQRRAVLESPTPLDVLDNPGFELGAARPSGGRGATIAGWEVVELRRGAIAAVPGAGGAAEAGRGLEFSSFNGLSTLRSNPFPAPKTGRISVAAWLRIAAGSPQPPLRVAIEGVQGDREYYRFAAVGGLTGGQPLTGEWSQFVLQVDDLPAEPVDSMRVRFDLLGPGSVQIDDVRVFDLAFDESQRVQLTKAVSLLEHQCQAGEWAACLAGLDGYWPAFLESFVSDAAVTAMEESRQATTAPGPAPEGPAERQAGGMFDRMRSWWQ